MARIVISLSGEGRGHAARTFSLLQMLEQHRVLVLAPENLIEWMRASTAVYPHVSIAPLPGLRFQYHSSGKLSYLKSWTSASPFIRHLGSHLRTVSRVVEEHEPHLAIADFEPLLPRVARHLKIPLLSLDHQHFLAAIDTRQLPMSLRLQTLFLRPRVKLFCPSADRHLVSSFYRYPQRPGTKKYEQVGVLLRSELGSWPSQVGEHLLVYVRRNGAATWLPKLNAAGFRCIVYGCERQAGLSNLEFRPIGNQQFLQDLVTCRALITTAGNQLVGEAIATGKPVFAIPEQGNFEQQLNGYFLQQQGVGRSVSGKHLTIAAIRNFVDGLDDFRRRLAGCSVIGNERVSQCIEAMLPLVSDSRQVNTPLVSEASAKA